MVYSHNMNSSKPTAEAADDETGSAESWIEFIEGTLAFCLQQFADVMGIY